MNSEIFGSAGVIAPSAGVAGSEAMSHEKTKASDPTLVYAEFAPKESGGQRVLVLDAATAPGDGRTLDSQAIVSDLAARGERVDDCRIIYEGAMASVFAQWCEIEAKGGLAAGAKLFHAYDMDEAVEAVGGARNQVVALHHPVIDGAGSHAVEATRRFFAGQPEALRPEDMGTIARVCDWMQEKNTPLDRLTAKKAENWMAKAGATKKGIRAVARWLGHVEAARTENKQDPTLAERLAEGGELTRSKPRAKERAPEPER